MILVGLHFLERTRLMALGMVTRHPAASCVSTLVVIASATALLGPVSVLALFAIAGLVAFPGGLLAAYLLVPFLYKASIQPYLAFDLTVGLVVPTSLVAGRLLIVHRSSRSSRWPLSLWSALALLIILGVFVADDRGSAIKEATYWLALAFLPLSASLGIAQSSAYLRQFLMATLLFCLPFVVVGVVVLALSALEPALGFVRLFGANYIGVGRASFLVALLTMGYPGTSLPERFQVLRLALFVASVTVGTAGGARGPVLTFGVVAVAWMLFRLARSQDRGRTLRRVVFPLGLALSAAIGATAALFPVVLFRFALLFEYAASLLGLANGQGGASISARANAYRLAAELFQSEPVVGTGTGAYAAAARSEPVIAGFEYPHNLVLQFAAEFGLLGLGLFAAILVAAFARHLPAEAGWVTVRATAAFLALGGLFSNGIYDYRIFWAYVLLLMAAPAVQSSLLRRHSR